MVKSTLRRGRITLPLAVLAVALTVTGAAVAGAGGSTDVGGPDVRGPFAAHAKDAPTLTADELGPEDAAGYYRIAAEPDASGYVAPPITVYWIPSGAAKQAPAEIRATAAYRDSLAAGSFAGQHATIYGPRAAGFEPAGDVQLMGHRWLRCPNYWFCVFQHNYGHGAYRQFQDAGYWQHLSNYGFNDVTSSVWNRRDNDSKLSEHINASHQPGGIIRCYDSRTRVSDLSDAFNDKASGIGNARVDGQC